MMTLDEYVDTVKALEAAARAAEREACAKIADDVAARRVRYGGAVEVNAIELNFIAGNIAAAIRARGKA